MNLKDFYNDVKLGNEEMIVFVKYGNFYRCFNNDAVIINYLFNYKLSEKNSTGFPIKSIDKVISILRNNVEVENMQPVVKNNLWEMKIKDLKDVESRYYLRITVSDKPGVLGQITTIFGANKVSLKSVIQKGVKQEENIDVTLVLITHSTTEGLIMDSIDRLYDLKTVKSIDNIIRIEDFK